MSLAAFALAAALLQTPTIEVKVLVLSFDPRVPSAGGKRLTEVIGWNKHERRLFHRPISSMGVNFRQCHPQESLHKVEAIVGEMKEGKRDRARFWIDLPVGPQKETHKILIEFYALRDPEGKYLGCLECTQDVEEIRRLEGQQRLLT